MSDVAIKVEGLSKRYKIGRLQRHNTLRDRIADTRLFNLFKRRNGRTNHSSLINHHSDQADTIWALQDVSFEIRRGEVVGIIGRNGAGKSTLLKILSRITEPTKGYADITGRIASLLEVGTGFHPELTGRENIYLNGSILGMKRVEINKKFDEIVAFAEIEKFIDTPVKHYSSGMYLRLAFAVAAHLEPEILLVDEVLAVGDAAFQKRCLGKMGDVAREGRTVLFVSHNMGSLKQLCPRGILLSQGSIEDDASIDVAIAEYLNVGSSMLRWRRDTPIPRGKVVFEEIQITDEKDSHSKWFDSTTKIVIKLTVLATDNVTRSQIAIRVTNQEGIPVFTTTNSDAGRDFERLRRGRHTYKVEIPPNLLPPGFYTLLVAACIPFEIIFDKVEGELSFMVEDGKNHATVLRDGRLGVVTPLIHWHKTDVSITSPDYLDSASDEASLGLLVSKGTLDGG